MAQFDAFADFPQSGTLVACWSLGRGDSSARFEPFQHRTLLEEGPSLSTDQYPRVVRAELGSCKRGGVFEAGTLLAHPAPTRLTTFTDAVIRFHAPAAAAYDVIIELKSAEIGYGGTLCRVVKGAGTVLDSHYIARHFGSHWEYATRLTLEENETLSLFVGPSRNGDNASDTTQVRFRVQSVSDWRMISAVSLMPLTLTGSVAAVFAVAALALRSRRQAPPR